MDPLPVMAGGLFLRPILQFEDGKPDERILLYFPLAHGVPRVDDRHVLSGIIYGIRNDLQWKDAPKEYGPHKTLYNCFFRWNLRGVLTGYLRLWWNRQDLLDDL